jgi:hypothetical protein
MSIQDLLMGCMTGPLCLVGWTGLRIESTRKATIRLKKVTGVEKRISALSELFENCNLVRMPHER